MPKLCGVREVCSALVRVVDTAEPELAAAYEKKYQQFRTLCPALKGVFAELAE